MNPYIDLLLILFIICTGAAAGGFLIYGIYRMVNGIHSLKVERHFEEDMIAISIYRSVCERTDSLVPVRKFESAMRIAFEKDDLRNSSLDETAEKIAEAVAEINLSDMAMDAIER